MKKTTPALIATTLITSFLMISMLMIARRTAPLAPMLPTAAAL